MKECIFCKIINKEASADIVYEDDDIIVFKDIKPSAPVHILFVPKKHIDSVKELEESDKELVGKLVLSAKKIAEEKGLNGYRLSINVGRSAGQIIDHLHLHLMANK